VGARARKRRELLRAQLPDALDLLAVSVEAGLGFDGALSKLTEHMDGPLTEEFGLTLNEIRIGESLQDALKKLSTRCDTPEVSGFSRAIIQADQLGISLGRILRVQATDTRLRRQALAEQEEVFEAGAESGQGLSRRASALDARDAKLAEFQAELDERERKVRDQRQTIGAEHARLAELQAELAGEQQLSAESHEQAE